VGIWQPGSEPEDAARAWLDFRRPTPARPVPRSRSGKNEKYRCGCARMRRRKTDVGPKLVCFLGPEVRKPVDLVSPEGLEELLSVPSSVVVGAVMV